MCDIVWVSPQEHWVSISSYRHRSDLVWSGNGSVETIVIEEEQSPVVGLWGRPRGVHWPPRPTSRILSIDCWCQLVPTHATKAFGMSGEMVVGWRCHDVAAKTKTVLYPIPSDSVEWALSSWILIIVLVVILAAWKQNIFCSAFVSGQYLRVGVVFNFCHLFHFYLLYVHLDRSWNYVRLL